MPNEDRASGAYEPPRHLPAIAGLVATARPNFDRESWTTCHMGHLTQGHVFALPDIRPIQPVVLTETRLEGVPGEIYDLVIGTARRVDSGAVEAFRFRTNTSVLTRCDLHYVAAEQEA